MATARDIQPGMAVYGADGQQLGTVTNSADGSFSTAERQLTLEAIERIADGKIYLWSDTTVYDPPAATDATLAQQEHSQRLPDTDAPLYVNEREVSTSLEDRLPRDGQR